jgi:uncharacterized membrane protein YwzB
MRFYKLVAATLGKVLVQPSVAMICIHILSIAQTVTAFVVDLLQLFEELTKLKARRTTER